MPGARGATVDRRQACGRRGAIVQDDDGASGELLRRELHGEGQVISRDQMLNCQHEFAPDADKLTMESSAPLKALPNGKYPVPEPGIKKGAIWREYYDA